MNLTDLLVKLDGLKSSGNLDIEISKIETDSKKVVKDSLFIAIKGYKVDGHDFIGDAINNGAIAIVIDETFDYKSIPNIKNVTLITCKNTRYASAIISCNFYKNPSERFKLIGITGTKGKTTTAFMIKEILEKQGKKVGLIGTVATYINNELIKYNDRTTPEAPELQELFAKMVEKDVEYVVMEVSSQSLKLDRVTGTNFDIGVFTNFSKDHIGGFEHESMEDYFNSKLKLFSMCKLGIINSDDLQALKIKKINPEMEFITYGIDNECNLLAKDVSITNSSSNFKVKIDKINERIKVDIPGRFSVYNALASIAVTKRLGIDTENIKEALLNVKVPGRSELVPNKKELVIMIDYAHSPNSLENILTAVKTYTRGKVISVFGCGGDRDSSKREIMGEISGRISDITIITSDNPRNEEPEKIVNQIENGIKKTKGQYKCIVDRKEAIRYAISIATKSDIIVLLGKGHETYQIIGNKNIDFDERKIIKEIIG